MNVPATVSPYSTGMDSGGRSLEEGFPVVDPEFEPYGSRVLVQLRTVMKTSRGGIDLPPEVWATEAWNEQVGKVIKCGPLSFKNRRTGEDWPEGAWFKSGDYVRVPRYGGDRWSVKKDGIDVVVVAINDADMIGGFTGNPMAIKAYIA